MYQYQRNESRSPVAILSMKMVDKRSAHLIGSPGVFLPRLPQHPACGGPHGARPSDWKGLQHDDRAVLQSWLRHTAPRPFHPVGYSTSVSGARLALCRRFGPSPCPVHYGERLATTPSADFCPLTHDVAAARAARITVRAGASPALSRGASVWLPWRPLPALGSMAIPAVG